MKLINKEIDSSFSIKHAQAFLNCNEINAFACLLSGFFEN